MKPFQKQNKTIYFQKKTFLEKSRIFVIIIFCQKTECFLNNKTFSIVCFLEVEYSKNIFFSKKDFLNN
jgi:hypothetical protein